MKTNLIIFILVLCVGLSGCGKPIVTSGDPADVSSSISSSVTQQETPLWEAEKVLDFSGHTFANEADYLTILSDLSKLSGGGRVFAVEPQAANWSWRQFDGFVKNENSSYDVRGFDISEQDLSVVDDYNDLTFSTGTVWPDSLPEGFDPVYLLEYNKNPGLGIRDLHKKGITGDGIGIAIIDQALYLEHAEYKDNLMLYEQIHCSDRNAQMHGPAVASIAVGKTTGVAPGAKLYYIAESHGHSGDYGYEFDASIIADSVLRVLEINRYLPYNEKIRVISISRGYEQEDKGYAELTDAIAQADKENIFVITTSPEHFYDFPLYGMCSDYRADPDDFDSFLPAGWAADAFYADPDAFSGNIMFPMSRTYAACTGAEDYEIAYQGGLSWAVPWCAGFYALCCQVKPDITPQEFIAVLDETGISTNISHDNQIYPFGKIVNPAGVIDKIK